MGHPGVLVPPGCAVTNFMPLATAEIADHCRAVRSVRVDRLGRWGLMITPGCEGSAADGDGCRRLGWRCGSGAAGGDDGQWEEREDEGEQRGEDDRGGVAACE